MERRLGTNAALYCLLPTDIRGFRPLAELALDMRWSWNHAADQLWSQIDPDVWNLTQNPWVVLQTAAPKRIERLLRERGFRDRLAGLVKARKIALQAPTWFQDTYPQSPLRAVAYFSMEFMLSEALPIYSGGLGNVAGDQLKAASDLGVPVIGIGLLYDQGYFRQVIDENGDQQAIFPYNDPSQLPVTPLRRPNGEWMRFQLDFLGHPFWLRAWQVQVGRTSLCLLDSNDPANAPPYRGVTSELYGGGPYLRLMQELVLGIGGWRLLKQLGIDPEVCHLNEGHAALATLERVRSFMNATGQSFEVALMATRAGNLFTTHTAVPVGFDRFEPELIDRCLGNYANEQLGISLSTLLALGRQKPEDDHEPFNMAYLAIRGSGAINGVSQLHGRVSRRLFEPLFPRWPSQDVPVGSITNGIHVPTWDSIGADRLWTRACGKERWRQDTASITENIRRLGDEELWDMRMNGRKRLVNYARNRLSRQLASSGAAPIAVDRARYLLDANVLTIGFARRFASYKRPDFLLSDPDRLLKILTDVQRPVQLIIAGKAHPADETGQALIRKWIRFIRSPSGRQHAIFLSDHDALLTEHLVHGVDVWLNTPRRPWEACGTSGMKVLANGGLNLSELDGWWAEAYSPEVGWAIGGDRERDDDPGWDKSEADSLYDLLETRVLPEFYDRDSDGIPRAWVARIRESMAQLTPQFSTNRSVREYTEKHYLRAASKYRERTASSCDLALELVDWTSTLRRSWATLRFGEVRVRPDNTNYCFEVEVDSGNLSWDDICVELYANPISNSPMLKQEMTPVGERNERAGKRTYIAVVPSNRPASDFTPRIIPRHRGIEVPLEIELILWKK